MEEILTRITQYRLARGWSEYALAEMSGVPQTTISSWYRKCSEPKISSLQKICEAFDITMSELFAGKDSPVVLTERQRSLLDQWTRLDRAQQDAVLRLMENM